MKKTLLLLLTLISLHAPLKSSAAVIYFDVFSSQSITTTTELNDLQITATLTQNLNSVDMLLLNGSTFTSPVITQIAIDDSAGLLSVQPSIANNQFSTFFEDNNTKVSGANNISFVTDYGWKAEPPPILNGIGVGEYTIISFDTITISEIQRAIDDNTFRIALHVQSIGATAQSASLVSVNKTVVTPEPSSAFLFSLGMCMLLFMRK